MPTITSPAPPTAHSRADERVLSPSGQSTVAITQTQPLVAGGLLGYCNSARGFPEGTRHGPADCGDGDDQVIKLKAFTFSLFGASVTWEMTKRNKEIAQGIIRYLEDRRLLFGPRGQHPNDPIYCLKSAQGLRTYLGEQFETGEPGKALTQAIQEMRRACRNFIDRAGPEAATFQEDRDSFIAAASELRTTLGFYVAALASRYGLSVDDDLASILPPRAGPESDLNIVPGFEVPRPA